MSDRLKQYIQQHKKKLDNQVPPPEFFDRIVKTNEKSKFIDIPKRKQGKNKYFYFWIAASICVLLVFILGIQIQNGKTDQALTQITEPFPKSVSPKLNNNLSEENSINNFELAKISNSNKLPIIDSKRKTIKKNKLKSSTTIFQNERVEYQNGFDQLVSILKDSSYNANKIDSAPVNLITKSDIVSEDHQNIKKEEAIIQNIRIDSMGLSEPLIAQNNQTSHTYSIGKVIFKGFMKLISKKSSEWTSNVLRIETQELNQKTFIALNYKSETVAFHKSIGIPIQ